MLEATRFLVLIMDEEEQISCSLMAKRPLNCKRMNMMYESTCKECIDARGVPTVR